jgi:hypothetical protein
MWTLPLKPGGCHCALSVLPMPESNPPTLGRGAWRWHTTFWWIQSPTAVQPLLLAADPISRSVGSGHGDPVTGPADRDLYHEGCCRVGAGPEAARGWDGLSNAPLVVAGADPVPGSALTGDPCELVVSEPTCRCGCRCPGWVHIAMANWYAAGLDGAPELPCPAFTTYLWRLPTDRPALPRRSGLTGFAGSVGG